MPAAPRPRPPLALRPSRLSVTQIETWCAIPTRSMRATFCGCEPLDPIAAAPGAGDRGTLIHAALEAYAALWRDGPPEDAAWAPRRDRPQPVRGPHGLSRRGRLLVAALPARRRCSWSSSRRDGGPASPPSPAETRRQLAWRDRRRAGASPSPPRRTASRSIAPGGLDHPRLQDRRGAELPGRSRPASPRSSRLEGAMLLGGGFEEAPTSLAELVVVGLGAASGGFDDRPLAFENGSADDVSRRALARLDGLVARFEDEATPYASLPAPDVQGPPLCRLRPPRPRAGMVAGRRARRPGMSARVVPPDDAATLQRAGVRPAPSPPGCRPMPARARRPCSPTGSCACCWTGRRPQRMLCLTFTKAAAAEMANRMFAHPRATGRRSAMRRSRRADRARPGIARRPTRACRAARRLFAARGRDAGRPEDPDHPRLLRSAAAALPVRGRCRRRISRCWTSARGGADATGRARRCARRPRNDGPESLQAPGLARIAEDDRREISPICSARSAVRARPALAAAALAGGRATARAGSRRLLRPARRDARGARRRIDRGGIAPADWPRLAAALAEAERG